MIMANDAKQPQATGNALWSFGSDPPIAPGYTRVRGCSGANFGGPLRATVRFLDLEFGFAPRCTIDRRG